MPLDIPSPSPGPPARIPDPGVRPVPSPAPQRTPAPASTTGAKPGLVDRAIDALTPDLPSVPGAGALSDINDGITAIRAWVTDRHNWVRVAWFLTGSAMFTTGIVMIGARPITNATAAVVKPVGRIVKSAYKG